MKAVEFPEVNVRIAENQPQYATLPAHYITSQEGVIVACFELTPEERAQVAETGCIYLHFLTFNRPFQPIGMTCLKPENFKWANELPEPTQ